MHLFRKCLTPLLLKAGGGFSRLPLSFLGGKGKKDHNQAGHVFLRTFCFLRWVTLYEIEITIVIHLMLADRETHELYLHMFGFSTLKRGRGGGGKESRLGRKKSIKDISHALRLDQHRPSLDVIADEAMEKLQADQAVAAKQAALSELAQNAEPQLPNLACPSSELKSRQVRVQHWMTSSSQLRPSSRTLVPLV